jgi:hypothetical protein
MSDEVKQKEDQDVLEVNEEFSDVLENLPSTSPGDLTSSDQRWRGHSAVTPYVDRVNEIADDLEKLFLEEKNARVAKEENDQTTTLETESNEDLKADITVLESPKLTSARASTSFTQLAPIQTEQKDLVDYIPSPEKSSDGLPSPGKSSSALPSTTKVSKRLPSPTYMKRVKKSTSSEMLLVEEGEKLTLEGNVMGDRGQLSDLGRTNTFMDKRFGKFKRTATLKRATPGAGGTLRRNATTKRMVELTKQGHLVVDCPVPREVYEHSSFPEFEEFRYMRYTAVTCDPNTFCTEKYQLRQQVYNRETEIAIVVTMYNEDDELFCRTMMSLMQNIAYICKRKSTGWGEDGWKKIVICIVSDGRSKCDQRVLMALSVMGVYQDGVAKNEVNGQPVSAHLYEYTTQVCIDEDLDVWDGSKGVIPVQILFCLKEKNARKINSHRWFFNAFCESLQPDVCILIDVGTKPSINSVYDLWRAFHFQENLGGACGEIMADLGAGYTRLANALVASQNFEYKMSNILDKPLESVFGYISVLPGAFSAYRFAALKDISPGDGPLSKYFHGEDTSKNTEWNMFDANMFLAEDRILCFELFVKRRQNWCLRYVRVCSERLVSSSLFKPLFFVGCQS